MSHTLISFLGKVRKNTGGKYITANYDFDGITKTTQFFGLALTEIIKPDRLIVLGTSGSMWDIFYEKFAESDLQEEQWLKLSEASGDDRVTQELLDECEVELSAKLGLSCLLKLIPYGVDQSTQVEILKVMAEDIQLGDQVSLDLTHGLRHLPMLGLLSSMYLQTAKHVEIKGIYYGALDLTTDTKTPVMRLDGLLNISGWIAALHGFDKTGDIAPFSELLKQEGLADETADYLKTAAFHESLLSITNARPLLNDFAKQTKEGLPGIAHLFEDSLKERIRWKDQDSIYLRQREKAIFFLQQSDYLRAAFLGYEALLTFHIVKNNPSADTENYELRQSIKTELDSTKNQLTQEYKLLRNIRNCLAHVSRPDTKDVQKAFSSEERLRKTLGDLFNKLLPSL